MDKETILKHIERRIRLQESEIRNITENGCEWDNVDEKGNVVFTCSKERLCTQCQNEIEFRGDIISELEDVETYIKQLEGSNSSQP